jgi:GAF domain-containing protein
MRVFDQMTLHGCHTILAAPMSLPRQQVAGVIQLLNKMGRSLVAPRVFTPLDERLLTAMAAQAAIIVQNARTYAQETARDAPQKA